MFYARIDSVSQHIGAKDPSIGINMASLATGFAAHEHKSGPITILTGRKHVEQMKPIASLPALASVLFALLLTATTQVHASLTVTTTVTAASNPINICTDHVILTTLIHNNNPGTIGAFDQLLPLGCTINSIIQLTPGIIWGGGPNNISYAVLPPFISGTLTADISIPCSVLPTVIGTGQFLIITHSPTFGTITAPDVQFQVSIPKMNFVNFSTPSPNVPLEVLVRPNLTRTFDILVSSGKVHEFEFTYTPESEIGSHNFIIEGVANGTPTTHALGIGFGIGSNPFTYSITPGFISWLFTGDPSGVAGGTPLTPYDMVYNDSIRVKEFISVIQCSPTLNDSTVYSLEWTCPTQNNTCNTVSAQRSLLVQTSTGGMTPFFSFIPPPGGLDLCGAPSDIVFEFRNSSHDANRIAGSAMKTLHTIEIDFNMADFSTINGIFLEGRVGSVLSGPFDINPLTTTLSHISPFYTYDSVTQRITLDFDTLNNVDNQLNFQPLGPNGPLVSGFIAEIPIERHNELVEDGAIILRFTGASFNCQGPFYNGFHFDDCGKPAVNYMFIGHDVNSSFTFTYDDMCMNPQIQPYDRGRMHNNFPMTSIAESDVTDVFPGSTAVLDFYYVYTGGSATPSPFLFEGALSGTPYFDCLNTYQAILTIPDKYTLNSAMYFADPNNPTVSVPLTLPSPVLTGSDNVYTFTDSILGFNGLIKANVTLINCPINTGGYDTFSIRIQAICNGCLTCAYTITCFDTSVFFHCQGFCGNTGSVPPQTTISFDFERNSFGWTDETMLNQVTATSGVKLGRAYKCDRIKVEALGSIVPGTLNTNLAFRIEYTSGANHQFFVFESGDLTYVDNLGTHNIIIVSSDIVSNCAPTACGFLVNFSDPAFLTAIQNSTSSVSLSLQMIVKVDLMSAIPPGAYKCLPLVEGQFWSSNFGVSCDPFHEGMTVLNVTTQKSFNILPASYANQSLGLGWDFPHGYCDQRFLFSTNVLGGLTGLDDFPPIPPVVLPIEYRSIVEWPNPISMGLPNVPSPGGVHFDSAFYSVFGRTQWFPVNQFNTTVTSGQTITSFSTYNDSGLQKHWHELDKDGLSINMVMAGTLNLDCPSTIADPIVDPVLLNFPFTENVYTSDTDCLEVNALNPPDSAVTDILLYPAAVTPVLLLTSATPVYNVTSTPLTITGIDFALLGGSRMQFDCSWIRPVSPGLNITFVHLNGGASIGPDINGNFQLGAIAVGSPAHLTFDFTFSGCAPGANIPLTIECCASCTCNPPGPACLCQNPPYTFNVLPEVSAMSMFVAPPVITPQSLCYLYDYTVTITNTALGDLEDLELRITLPSGWGFTTPSVIPQFERRDDGVNIITTGTLSTVTQLPQNVYTWDINQDVYGGNGMPSTPANVVLHFTVTCNGQLGSNHDVIFHAIATNVCGGAVTCPDYIDTQWCSAIICAGDKTVPCGSNWSFDPPTPSCCGNGFTFSILGADVTTPGPCPQSYSITRAWTSSNTCGDGTTCSQTVTVVDTPPIITCAGPQTIECPATPSFLSPAVQVTCDPNPLVTFSDTTTTGACPQDRSTTRIWTVTDNCNNIASCSQTISVVDTTPPVFSALPGPTSIPCPLQPAFVTPTVQDGCGSATLLPFVDVITPGACPQSYSTTRNWTAHDACGNSSTASQTIDVVDTTPPVLNCPVSFTVQSTVQAGANVTFNVTAIGDCDLNPLVTCTPGSGSFFPCGTTSVTCTAIDACGNIGTSCTFTVTVQWGLNVVGQFALSDGGGDSQIANAIAVDKLGNSLVAGTFLASGTFSTANPLTSAGGEDSFLAKYGTNGNFMWVVQFGGPGNDAALGVAVDDQGYCFVTGYFNNAANFYSAPPSTSTQSITSTGGGDIFVAQYDPLGALIWVMAAGGPGNDGGTGVAVDGFGDPYVTGTFETSATFTLLPTPIVVSGNGNSDCFLAKYTSAGVPQWADASSGPAGHNAQSRGVAVDASGKAWIVGIFSDTLSFGTTTPLLLAPSGNSFAFVAHYDQNAATPWIWSRQSSCSSTPCGNQDGRAIGVDAGGNSFFTAYYNGDATIGTCSVGTCTVTDLNHLDFYDALVGSYDPAGLSRWLINGLAPSLSADQEPRGLTVDPTGNVYVTGFLNASFLFASAGKDVWLSKYDTSGTLLWTETALGTGNQFNAGRAVAVDRAGCVIMTGSFVDQNLAFSGFVIQSDGILTTPFAAEEIVLVKYCPMCELAPVAPINLTATPSDGQVTLDWDDIIEADLQGYNVYRSDAGGAFNKVNTTLVAQTDFVDPGRTNGTEYCYRVRAVNPAGESPDSDTSCATPQGGGITFRRGDVDGNGTMDISDAVGLLGSLFLGTGTPPCLEAGDTDNSGTVDISDSISSLSYQFLGGPEPAPPGPRSCGPDPVPPFLGCTKSC